MIQGTVIGIIVVKPGEVEITGIGKAELTAKVEFVSNDEVLDAVNAALKKEGGSR